MACSVTGALIFLEIQIRKEGMNKARYYQELGAMEAFMKSVMEEMVELDQRGDKVTTKDFFFLTVGFPQRSQLILRHMLVLN